MEKLKLNHYAIWLAIVLQFILGFLWYGPFFGEKWMLMVGLDLTAVEAIQPGIAIWLTNIISTIAAMYLLAWLFLKIEIRTALRGLFTAFLIAVTFIFLTTLTNNVFARLPYGLAWITGGFSMVGFSIAGTIYGVWTKKA
ncbi:MAG: DUF1761 domain-containing protein [Bacteroidales bacterium]|jgi:hypothetical protein|nr:DUF1761 domain-containing protein [Bacteroidales bacterium]